MREIYSDELRLDNLEDEMNEAKDEIDDLKLKIIELEELLKALNTDAIIKCAIV
jgi:predicted  nucleic acid-binding Zn-ribbon protein